MKILRQTDIIGERGIALIHSIVTEMGSLWQPTGLEAGIDGNIEFRDPSTGEMLNQHLAVQSKATDKPFGPGNPTYTCREKDLEYWLKGNLPIILVYSHPDSREAFWVSIRDYFADPAQRRSRKIVFDRERDRFDASAFHRLVRLAAGEHSGVYLAPPPSPEKIITNLAKIIRLPRQLFHAHTSCTSPTEVRRLLNDSGGRDLHEWAYRGKRLLSVHDLSEQPWRRICDTGTVEPFTTSEWSDSYDVDRRDDFVALLNRCLRAKLSAMHVRYDAKENYYHFTATRDLAPRRIRYRSMQQMTAREVFKPYRTTKGDRILEYYRHNAFHGRFRRYEGSWYLQIDPTYRFTTDGRTIHPNARNLLSGIRKLERNQAVLNHVVMWVSLLQDPDTQDLFAPRAYPHLGFGDLVALESPVGIPDKLWAASESAENAQDGAPDDELLELAFVEDADQ